MHNVQHSQAMMERGVCELGNFFFHYQSKKKLEIDARRMMATNSNIKLLFAVT